MIQSIFQFIFPQKMGENVHDQGLFQGGPGNRI